MADGAAAQAAAMADPATKAGEEFRQREYQKRADSAAKDLEEFKQFCAAETVRRKAEATAEAARRIAEADHRKKAKAIYDAKPPCCHLGMTEAEVRASKLGGPARVNRTIDAAGVREQWVYAGDRVLLYFENGVLTTIQD